LCFVASLSAHFPSSTHTYIHTITPHPLHLPPQADLFDPDNLFYANNFQQVLLTLARLSQTPQAAAAGMRLLADDAASGEVPPPLPRIPEKLSQSGPPLPPKGGHGGLGGEPAGWVPPASSAAQAPWQDASEVMYESLGDIFKERDLGVYGETRRGRAPTPPPEDSDDDDDYEHLTDADVADARRLARVRTVSENSAGIMPASRTSLAAAEKAVREEEDIYGQLISHKSQR
jgi:hypothetical protein